MRKYSTNEICQLCSVSRKQLRYYEERGFLSDVPRRQENNYRYYTSEHVYEIVAAKALRNIDMSLNEMKDIVYGNHVGAIQQSLEQQLSNAKDALELSLHQYEQSAIVYSKISEALAFLRLHYKGASEITPEIVNYPGQDIVSLSYETTFEDETYMDVDYLPKIQNIAQNVNAVSIGSLLYTTYGHFDSDTVMFDGAVHPYKIAIPVLDQKKPCDYYDSIPPFHGVSTLHIGDPKDGKLYDSYIRLLIWAKKQGYKLQNNSLEEWLISPMITNNKDLWVIRIVIPFK